MQRAAWTFLTTTMAMTVVACAAPAQTASPASADAKYCGELIQLYRTYINDPDDPRPARMSPNVTYENAIASCQAGNPAAGIPVLETALKNARFTLPPRG